MEVRCQGPGCGVVFEAARATAKYHSDTCRQRARRAGAGQAKPRPRARSRSYLAKATRGELAAAGRLASAAGQSAMILARRIDSNGAETGAALAAMITAHAAAMERALRESGQADPLAAPRAKADELGARRERKLGGGSRTR